MKHVRLFFFGVATFLFLNECGGQSFADSESKLLMMKFDPMVSWDSIQLLKARYQATQIDSTPKNRTDVKLWLIAPTVIRQHQTLSKIVEDIDGSYNTKKKIKVSVDTLVSFQNERLTSGAASSTCWSSQLGRCRATGTEKPVRVAIIDSGMDIFESNGNAKHPLLARYFNKTLSKDFTNVGSVKDVSNHGTAMASVIAQMMDAGGIQGSATELIALKIFNNNQYASPWSLVKAIDYAIEKQVHVINLSLNWKTRKPRRNQWAIKPILELVIDYAGTKNITVIGAAGNDGANVDRTADTLMYHSANYASTNLIVVGATDCNGRLLAASNWGIKSVDIAALGANVNTIGLNQVWESHSGTSLSGAIVSGLAAVKSSHRSLAAYPVDVVAMRSALFNAYAVSGHASLMNKLNRGEILKLSCNRTFEKVVETSTQEISMEVFPNPVSNGFVQIRYTSPTDEMVQLIVQDVLGQTIHTSLVPIIAGENLLNWEADKTLNGLFMITLRKGQQSFTRKLVITQ